MNPKVKYSRQKSACPAYLDVLETTGSRLVASFELGGFELPFVIRNLKLTALKEGGHYARRNCSTCKSEHWREP
jgi:hypothetical protein